MIYILRKYILCFLPLGRVVHCIYSDPVIFDTLEPEAALLSPLPLSFCLKLNVINKGKKTKLNWICILFLVRGLGHIIHLFLYPKFANNQCAPFPLPFCAMELRRPRREDGLAAWLALCPPALLLEVLGCSVASCTGHSVLDWMFADVHCISSVNLLSLCKEEFHDSESEEKHDVNEWLEEEGKRGSERSEEIEGNKSENGQRQRKRRVARVGNRRRWWGRGSGVGTVTFEAAAPSLTAASLPSCFNARGPAKLSWKGQPGYLCWICLFDLLIVEPFPVTLLNDHLVLWFYIVVFFFPFYMLDPSCDLRPVETGWQISSFWHPQSSQIMDYADWPHRSYRRLGGGDNLIRSEGAQESIWFSQMILIGGQVWEPLPCLEWQFKSHITSTDSSIGILPGVEC